MCVSEEQRCSFQTGIKERQEAEQWRKILGYKTKPKKKGGVEQTPAAVMSHTTEPPYTDAHKKSRRQRTYASVCVQKVLYLHTRCLHACLTSLCVQQTNHPCACTRTRIYAHTWREGCGAESCVIYRCTSSERERRRVREKEDGETRQGQRRGVS